MPKAKKKLLPKDFDTLLKAGDLDALKVVFESCLLDARGGYSKHTALAFRDCTPELARWLVGEGLDIEARDSYDRTALHDQAGTWGGIVEVLLDLGADIQAVDRDGDTPLHKAAKAANAENVLILCERGAPADVANRAGLTPLEAGLQYCSNIQIEGMAAIAELLPPQAPPPKKGLGALVGRVLAGGRGEASAVTPRMTSAVQRIGENFEFHRAGFNPDSVEAVSAGLDRLYVLFGVTPVPRRLMHDGKAPIVAKAARWQDQHQELWAMLVPSSGAAATVQGEVIRIAGKVADEIDRNGAANWDADFKAMTRAFLGHIGSGAPLPDAERERAGQVVAEVRDRDGAGGDLCELAVQWVKLNPAPIPLTPPAYTR